MCMGIRAKSKEKKKNWENRSKWIFQARGITRGFYFVICFTLYSSSRSKNDDDAKISEINFLSVNHWKFFELNIFATHIFSVCKMWRYTVKITETSCTSLPWIFLLSLTLTTYLRRTWSKDEFCRCIYIVNQRKMVIWDLIFKKKMFCGFRLNGYLVCA